MAPLSILPGRVRFADSRLIGNESLALHLESRICLVPGVSLVSAGYRTGRILVEFNELYVGRDEIAQRINAELQGDQPLVECRIAATTAATPAKDSPLSPRHILADIALHLILPAPFDLLLPAFRRG